MGRTVRLPENMGFLRNTQFVKGKLSKHIYSYLIVINKTTLINEILLCYCSTAHKYGILS